MYGLEDARLQYEAYAAAARASVVLQAKAELVQKGREWRDAGELLADLTDEDGESSYGIEVAGACVGGMLIARGQTDGSGDNDGQDHRIIRSMSRDGQLSLHITATRSPQGTYVNLAGPASPVVVRVS